MIPTDAPEHDDRLVEDYPTKSLEIGGDLTRPLAGGAIKFVGLATRQKRRTLDEYDAGDLGPTQITGGSQQLTQSQRNETIGRADLEPATPARLPDRSGWGTGAQHA